MTKTFRKIILCFIFFGSFLVWQKVEAACTGESPTWTTTPDYDSVSSCVSQANSGDTINVASGTATWSSSISWTDKNIKIIGAGIDSTIITGNTLFWVNMTKNSTGSWRISNMTFSGDEANSVIGISSVSLNNDIVKGWRIDHIRFVYSSGILMRNYGGVTFGLVDNCIFDGAGYGIFNIAPFVNGENGTTGHLYGDYAWSRPLNLGSDEYIYIEDCTVNFSTVQTYIFDSYYGGRAVVRHSNLTYTYFITHSPQGGNRGGGAYEVYNNTWIGAGHYRTAQLRSGTGVIFNNTVSGYSLNEFDVDDRRMNTDCKVVNDPLGECTGSNSYDGNVDSSGWPCVDQIGRAGGGTFGNQPSLPLYAWKNGSTSTCATGGECNNNVLIKLNDSCGSNLSNWIKTTEDANPHVGGIVDYINNGDTPMPGYTPYVYPHPLRGTADTISPAAPSGLSVN